MAVEQASGKSVDHRADIYSLGIILYEMLAGRRPFTAQTYGELVIEQLTVMPPSPSEVAASTRGIPKAIEQLVMRCLAKEREKRPASMAEVAVELEAELGELGKNQPVAPRRRKFHWVVPLSAATGLCLAYGYSSLVPRSGSESLPPEAITNPSVRLALDSAPAGALVLRRGSHERLGRTPLALALPRSGERLALEFQLDGFRTAEQEFSLLNDTRLVVTLKRIEQPPAHPESPSPVQPKPARIPSGQRSPPDTRRPVRDRDETLDPFAQPRR
jgi:serine/threonine-protein kinase